MVAKQLALPGGYFERVIKFASSNNKFLFNKYYEDGGTREERENKLRPLETVLQTTGDI